MPFFFMFMLWWIFNTMLLIHGRTLGQCTTTACCTSHDVGPVPWKSYDGCTLSLKTLIDPDQPNIKESEMQYTELAPEQDALDRCCQECHSESLCVAWTLAYGFCKLYAEGYVVKEDGTSLYGAKSGVKCPPTPSPIGGAPTRSPVVSPTLPPTSSPIPPPTSSPIPPPVAAPTATPVVSPTLSPTRPPVVSQTPSPTALKSVGPDGEFIQGTSPSSCVNINCGANGICRHYNNTGICEKTSICIKGIVDHVLMFQQNELNAEIACKEIYKIAIKENGQTGQEKNCAGDTDDTSYMNPAYRNCWENIFEVGKLFGICSFWDVCICDPGYGGADCAYLQLSWANHTLPTFWIIFLFIGFFQFLA